MKKIIHFAKYSKTKTGGIETTLRLFQDNKNYQNRFIVYSKNNSIDSDEVKCKVNFILFKQPISFSYFKNLVSILRKGDTYIVIHMPNLQLLPFIRLIRFINSKCILFWHADPISSESKVVQKIMFTILTLFIGRDINIIASSKFDV